MAALRAALFCVVAAAMASGGGEARAGEETPAGGGKEVTETRKIAARVVHRQKGLAEARAIALMGPPASRGKMDSRVTLTWNGSGGDCAMTAAFSDGALDGVTLETRSGAGSKSCKTLAKPLLDAAPAPGSPAAAAAASLSTLTNDSIITMVKEGRPAQAIIARIRTEPCRFDLSIEATMKLRREGVGEPVIQAMTDRDCR